jgi:hypothetical protein
MRESTALNSSCFQGYTQDDRRHEITLGLLIFGHCVSSFPAQYKAWYGPSDGYMCPHGIEPAVKEDE